MSEQVEIKILFVGVLDLDWSTNIPMKREFEKAGHEVVDFNYRTIAQSFVKNPESVWYKVKDKAGSLLRISWLPWVLKGLFYRVNGRKEMNKKLLEEVEEGGYDLVFLCKASGINYKIISEINNYAKTWYFFMDPLKRAKRMKAYQYAKRADWASATFSDVKRFFEGHGAESYFITQGVNRKLFSPPTRKAKKKNDVVFVGTATKKRKNLISYLKKEGIKVGCFGKGWGTRSVFRKELVQKYRRSKIILNICRPGTGFSIRVFQAMGTGSFLLSEYCPDLERIFEKGKHLDWFKTKEECLGLIRHYLKNREEREEIAKRGTKFVIENYSWENIIQRILNVIQKP